MAIGDNITEARKEAGLSQENLAHQAGLSMMSIRRYEMNEREPKLTDLERIAQVLNVSTNELLYGDTGTLHTVRDGSGATYTLYNPPKSSPNHLALPGKAGGELVITDGTEPRSDPLESELLDHFHTLNDEGQTEAVKRVGELSEIPRYQK